MKNFDKLKKKIKKIEIILKTLIHQEILKI